MITRHVLCLSRSRWCRCVSGLERSGFERPRDGDESPRGSYQSAASATSHEFSLEEASTRTPRCHRHERSRRPSDIKAETDLSEEPCLVEHP
jgi:hypothetical protein